MNWYATLADVKAELQIMATTFDALFGGYIEAASRWIDGWTRREFFVTSESRDFDGQESPHELALDDVLSITTFAEDSERDGTFDGQTWTEDTDFALFPYDEFPRLSARTLPQGSLSFSPGTRRYRITALWGYGDGESATPYEAIGVTVTVADATTTTLTLSAEGTIEAGHTIFVGTEQMFISAVTSDDSKKATAQRGVNGTTATEHTTAAASIFRYPFQVWRMTVMLAAKAFGDRGHEGLESERIGNYSYKVEQAAARNAAEVRILSQVSREANGIG